MFVPHGHKQPAVLCILKAGDRLLLLRRARDPNRGLYTPVGGKIDPFESPRDAAVREAREETGISVGAIRYCGTLVESSPGNYNWICFVYLAETGVAAPPPCVEGALEWVGIAGIEAIPTPVTDRFIYRYALGGRPFMFSAEYDAGLTLRELREEIEGVVVYADGRGGGDDEQRETP